MVTEDLGPLNVICAGDDPANVGDRHVDRTEQRDDSSRTGLATRVEAVAGSRPSRRLEQPETVVTAKLRNAEAHQLGELSDLDAIATLAHEPSLQASPG